MTAATAGQFDEDSLAQLHVNVRADGERVEEVEEFMQVSWKDERSVDPSARAMPLARG